MIDKLQKTNEQTRLGQGYALDQLSRRKLLSAAGAAALSGGSLSFPAIVRAQSKIQLKLSHYLPPTHGLQTDLMEPWARELEKQTQGMVSVQIFSATSSFGKAENQLSQVQKGLIDVAFGICGLPRGRMTASTIIEMPLLVQKANAGSRAIWDLYKSMFPGDYAGLKLLTSVTHNGGLIHTSNREIKKPEDLRGLRIRTPSPTVSAALEFLGASPIGMPPGQVYENMQKGILDGAAFPWDPVRSFKLAEVCQYHCDVGLYTASFWFAMNQQKFEKMPKDVQQVINSISGEGLLARIQPLWDKGDAAGKALAVERGNKITVIQGKDREAWKEHLKPLDEKLMKEFENEGVSNARGIYSAMREEVRKLELA